MLPTIVTILSLAAVPLGPGASGPAPWLPRSEPSPFVPEAGRFIVGPGAPTTASEGPWKSSGSVSHARATWHVRGPVRRAVLFLHNDGPIRAYFDGRLVWEPGQRLWTDVGPRLKPGPLFVALRAYSDWTAMFYAQMRVEYVDGSVEDFVTRAEGWQIAARPAEDWFRNPAAAGDWQPARDIGGYHPEPGQRAARHQEFASLPREGVRALVAEHNARLQREWPRDRQARMAPGGPDAPEWRASLAGFARLNERGELVDGAGQVRHLVFALYTNHGAYCPMAPEFDWDQYERDLEMMEHAGVHLYMREVGLTWLLDRDAGWQKLPTGFRPKGSGVPRCERAVELLDHFVRRARAHGRYIVFEGDFYWNVHAAIPWAYRTRYHLYPELAEANALAHRRVLARYADCTNVLGYMIGEEDILLAYDLANPHQHALFSGWLRRRYGTLDAFRRTHALAYDYADLSGFRPGLSPTGYWESNWRGLPPEPVLVPAYTPKAGVFDGIGRWSDIPLPGWPNYRSPDEPAVELGGHREIANGSIPRDPLWPDFYAFQQDDLYFGFVSRWARTVREAAPHQLLFFSNAQDSECSWHWPELYRRSDLPFDVIGVGDHDAGSDLPELKPWYTVRKAIKSIAAYRPYVRVPGAAPRGIATGEGEIGRKEHPEQVRNGYLGYLFDEIGGGVAWTQTYTWVHMAGGDTGALNRGDTPFLAWCGPFLRAAQGVSFALKRPVRVLIVRNFALANSNMSGLDCGDMYAVADAVSQLNLEFDIVMGRDLSHGPRRGKVDLTPYQLVIVPNAAVDQPATAWAALDSWLKDARHAGRRALAIGRVGSLDEHLQPMVGFAAPVARWLGASSYASSRQLTGRQDAVLRADGVDTSLSLDFGAVAPTGVLPDGEPFVTVGGLAVARRRPYGAGQVFAFGFPLGFASRFGSEDAPVQRPLDAMLPVLEAMARAAHVERPVLAPHNLRVYVSDDGRMVLVRERQGVRTDAEVAVRLPEGVRYPGLPMRRTADGYARFRVRLEPWTGAWWKAEEREHAAADEATIDK